jgi:putative ABC transport system substrate-binding protein
MVRVGVLVNPADSANAEMLSALPAISAKLGITFRIIEARAAADLEGAFATALREQLHAIQVALAPLYLAYRSQITAIASKSRIPAIFGERQFALAGGLISYGPSLADVYRRQAGLVDRILKGTSPADLPIERPTRLELVINLKAARDLGLVVPNSMQLLADDVVE